MRRINIKIESWSENCRPSGCTNLYHLASTQVESQESSSYWWQRSSRWYIITIFIDHHNSWHLWRRCDIQKLMELNPRHTRIQMRCLMGNGSHVVTRMDFLIQLLNLMVLLYYFGSTHFVRGVQASKSVSFRNKHRIGQDWHYLLRTIIIICHTTWNLSCFNW